MQELAVGNHFLVANLLFNMLGFSHQCKTYIKYANCI